jgi:uncharacterized membrane protein
MENLGEILMVLGFLLVAMAVFFPMAMSRDNDADGIDYFD